MPSPKGSMRAPISASFPSVAAACSSSARILSSPPTEQKWLMSSTRLAWAGVAGASSGGGPSSNTSSTESSCGAVHHGCISVLGTAAPGGWCGEFGGRSAPRRA